MEASDNCPGSLQLISLVCCKKSTNRFCKIVCEISQSCSGYWEGGLRCALIRCSLGPGKSEKGWDFGGEGTRGNGGQREIVYKQPGTKEDDSYHNWRVPSK